MSRSWDVVEEGTTACPGLSFDAIPSYASEYLSLTMRGGIPYVSVGGYVGIIQLDTGDLLRIRSKYGDNAYLKMLFSARNILSSSRINDLLKNAFAYDGGASPPELVSRAFARSLGEINAEGLLTSRVAREVTDSFSHGRIKPLATALRVARQCAKPIVSARSFKSTLTAEHRVLTRAATLALTFLRDAQCNAEGTICSRWLKLFPTEAGLEDIATIEQRVAEHHYAGSRGYYDRSLSLALTLLGISGISDWGDQISQDCVLVHTPTLFEEFARVEIMRRLGPSGFLVTKGAHPSNDYLYTGGSFELKPDICIYRKGIMRSVGDAKYKVPDAKDHYQLLTYMRSYHVRDGFFVSPVAKGTDAGITYRTHDGLTVHELKVDLSDMSRVSGTLNRVQELVA